MVNDIKLREFFRFQDAIAIMFERRAGMPRADRAYLRGMIRKARALRAESGAYPLARKGDLCSL